MKFFIVKMDTAGSNDIRSFPLRSNPSLYTDEELRNNEDGIWQCGESGNPDIIGNDFTCGTPCDGSKRKRRAIEGLEILIFYLYFYFPYSMNHIQVNFLSKTIKSYI